MARRKAGLGERHQKIMAYLADFQNENGYSPSIREIGEAIDVNSTSLVDYYLKQLEEKGYIERDSHISRSIRIVKQLPGVKEKLQHKLMQVQEAVNELIQIPVMGRIVASAPVPVPGSDVAYFDSESSVEIARSLLPRKEKADQLFALEVQGDSMIDAMVSDGDVVIMKAAKDANNGEMVAVWLSDEDETTLKYFYREKNHIRLQPANPSMEPIFIHNPEQVNIMGKVVLVIRQVNGKTD